MHEHGAFYTQDGRILSRYVEEFDPVASTGGVSILVDLGVGTLLKVGTADFVNDYFNISVSEYQRLGFSDMVKDLEVIAFKIESDTQSFSKEDFALPIDTVCTIINWFSNSIGDKAMNEFLGLALEEMLGRVDKLQRLGL